MHVPKTSVGGSTSSKKEQPALGPGKKEKHLHSERAGRFTDWLFLYLSPKPHISYLWQKHEPSKTPARCLPGNGVMKDSSSKILHGSLDFQLPIRVAENRENARMFGRPITKPAAS